VDCSNGVVHVINSVLLPNAGQLAAKVDAWNKSKSIRGKSNALPNLVQLAQSIPQLSTLVTAVVKAGLVNALSSNTLTVFAPTNDAFGRLPAQFLNYLLGNVTALTEVLTYHVVAGNITSSQLYDNEIVPTLDAGYNITVHKDQRGAIFVDFAQVIAPNNAASNGELHIIDEVILPY